MEVLRTEQCKLRLLTHIILKLDRPIKIAPGSKVIITIETADAVAENQVWYLLSSKKLEEAFGMDEPDYSADRIIIPNPEYQP